MKKGEIYEGVIDKVVFPNKGIIFVGEDTVTVKNGIPGQRIRFQINKKRKNRMEGRLLEVLEKSPEEVRSPLCSIFPACGGCMYQPMDYEAQLEMKAGQIRELMDQATAGAGQVDSEGKPDYCFEGITASHKEFK